MDYLRYSIFCKDNYNSIIKGNVDNNKYVIFGMSWCPWTYRSKTILKDLKFKIDNNIYTKKSDHVNDTYLVNKNKINNDRIVTILPDLVNNEFKLQMMYCLNKQTRSVILPKIWIDGNLIGGYKELVEYINNTYQINNISKLN